MLDFATTSETPCNDFPGALARDTPRLAEKARRGLRKVASGEYQAMAGWLEYGDALNEGRRLFPGKENDRAFGSWCQSIISPNLGDIHDDDRAAAMWAADINFPDRFAEMQQKHPKVRTVRGLHAKWKEAQRPKPKGPKIPKAAQTVCNDATIREAPAHKTYEVPTADDLRRIESLRVMIDYPTIEENVRIVAQRRLDKYTERFGDLSDTQSGNLPFRGSDELGDEIVSLVVSLCQTHSRVRSFLKDAIVHRYQFRKEMDLEGVLSFLQQIKQQPAE